MLCCPSSRAPVMLFVKGIRTNSLPDIIPPVIFDTPDILLWLGLGVCCCLLTMLCKSFYQLPFDITSFDEK